MHEKHDMQVPVEKSSTRNQYLCAIVCNLSCLCCGLYIAWPSYTNPLLLSEDKTIFAEPITPTHASLISGIPNLGAILGTPLFGWIYDRYGRKRGGLILAVPLALSWVMVITAPSAEYIIAARILAGVSGGGCTSLPPLYTGETADASIRGTVGSLLALSICSGLLLSYVVGSVAGYLATAVIFLSFTVLFAVLMSFMPETPVYLIKNGKEEEAAKSISWLRSVPRESSTVKDELNYLKMIVHNMSEMKAITDSDKKFPDANIEELKSLKEDELLPKTIENFKDVKRPAWKQIVLDPASRVAFLTALIMLTFQAIIGQYAIQTYVGSIFESAKTGYSTTAWSTVYGIILVAGSFFSTLLIDRAGRKFLMVLSCAVYALGIILFGASLQFGFGPAILPAIFLCVTAFAFTVGVGSVPFMVLGEYFSTDVKDLATCVLVQYNALLCFLGTYFFTSGVNLMGLHGLSYLYGGLSLAAVTYSLIFQPETKGLTYQQIIRLFRGDTNSERTET